MGIVSTQPSELSTGREHLHHAFAVAWHDHATPPSAHALAHTVQLCSIVVNQMLRVQWHVSLLTHMLRCTVCAYAFSCVASHTASTFSSHPLCVCDFQLPIQMTIVQFPRCFESRSAQFYLIVNTHNHQVYKYKCSGGFNHGAECFCRRCRPA